MSMKINEEDRKNYENKYKEEVFEKIYKIVSLQDNNIRKIEILKKKIGIKTRVPNIGITVNNKIVEISRIFKLAGISIYTEINEKGSQNKSFCGRAIIEDIISQTSESMDLIIEFYNTLIDILKQKRNKWYGLDQIKTVWRVIKNPGKLNNILSITTFSKDEIEKIEANLIKKKKMDDKIWNYNLKDNFIQSILIFINQNRDEYEIPVVLEESIIPTMQKLGLEEQIPELKEQLSKIQETNSEQQQILNTESKPWKLDKSKKLEIQRHSKMIAKEHETDKTNYKEKEDLEQQ